MMEVGELGAIQQVEPVRSRAGPAVHVGGTSRPISEGRLRLNFGASGTHLSRSLQKSAVHLGGTT
jgi:hypothetical protein